MKLIVVVVSIIGYISNDCGMSQRNFQSFFFFVCDNHKGVSLNVGVPGFAPWPSQDTDYTYL